MSVNEQQKQEALAYLKECDTVIAICERILHEQKLYMRDKLRIDRLVSLSNVKNKYNLKNISKDIKRKDIAETFNIKIVRLEQITTLSELLEFILDYNKSCRAQRKKFSAKYVKMAITLADYQLRNNPLGTDSPYKQRK